MTSCLLKHQLTKLKDVAKSTTSLLIILSQCLCCRGQPLKLTNSEFLSDSATKRTCSYGFDLILILNLASSQTSRAC
jgi:hypothetical protein